MTKRSRRLAPEVLSLQLIADLNLVLRCAAGMEEFRAITDPRVAEGFDFSYWADECEKVLGLPLQEQPLAHRERLSARPFRIVSGERERPFSHN